MGLLAWADLPADMRVNEVRPYYNELSKHRMSLVAKRVFDVCGSIFLFALTWWLFIILAVAIKLDSPGPVFFRQERVGRYGKTFRIFKFRTMCVDAEKKGAQVTSAGDSRITRVGSVIRKCRLDEVAQLIDILRGTMSFVGTRPEVPRYVAAYAPEMRATLLLAPGVTSRASIEFKDEDALLEGAEDVDAAYIDLVLPKKMNLNLRDLSHFSFLGEIATMFATISAVAGSD